MSRLHAASPATRRPVLVAVAHGSRDGRSAATMTELADVARARAPHLDVRLSFLDFNAPRLPDVLGGLGTGSAVVVPLLLGSAYHARVDIPAAVDAATRRLPRLEVVVSDVLGSAPGGGEPPSGTRHSGGRSPLLDVAWARLREAGADPGDPGLGVVLAAAGSSNAVANAVVADLAAERPLTVAAFAAAAQPDVTAAVAELRRRGARRIAVAPWFLAPGRLLDRVGDAARAADPGVVLAEPLGAAPAVADALLDRYRAATSALNDTEQVHAAG
ncbi:sirohydrochlorin chelatase [Pseudonocardia bannensis]|uniref:Sirohydrochlorin chelatase n=1 Tax=Pseudonocardia bannensis TaxID=630973 RepID=A0A848DSB6_9PSEU|nr:sirohydrochlorin chelatase [Pseudonocardia bannensis]NMH95379.1 sirohydrochlorin chelatase [Pseudonocardia bannensis]